MTTSSTTPRECVRSTSGHRMHYIQARKVSEWDGRPTRVSVTVHDDGLVDIHADDLDLTMWTHDPVGLNRPRRVLDRAQWIPDHDVLIVNGTMFSLARPKHRTPCEYVDGASDRAHGTDGETRD